MIIRARSPARIYFGGGGTDISPYPETWGGATLNASIDRYVYTTLVPKYDQSIQIASSAHKKAILYGDASEMKFTGDLDIVKAVIRLLQIKHGANVFIRSDMPPNTGLGTAAATAVSVIGAFNHVLEKKMNTYEIAEAAYKVEEMLGRIGGRQNQYSTAFGGINLIEYAGSNNARVIPLKMRRGHIYELEKSLILCYIGSRGDEGRLQALLKTQKDSYNDAKVLGTLDKLKSITYEMFHALSSGDLLYFGELMDDAFQTKKNIHAGFVTPAIEKVYRLARDSGAIGGRVLGLGGGGHMLFFCEPNKEHEVSASLQAAGCSIVDFGFEFDGLQSWEVSSSM
ncbi:MAG TPA: GHMP kinase [archaeon]|nr:GHMP kinase [archaeon]